MEFELQFTDKEITAWGDMGLMKRLLDRNDLDAALAVSVLPPTGEQSRLPTGSLFF